MMCMKIFFRRIIIPLCVVVISLNLISCASAPKSKVTGTKPYTVRGQKYYPLQSAHGFVEEGIASWYGPGFHGKLTANGETYNQNAMTAAHKLLPLGTTVKVTNLENGITLTLRINDRGPFVHDRVIDVSKRAAERLDMYTQGTARVRIVAINTKPTSSDVVKSAATAVGIPAMAASSSSSSSSGASSKDALEQAKESRVLNSEGEIPDDLKYLFEDEGTTTTYTPSQTAEEIKESVATAAAAAVGLENQTVQEIFNGEIEHSFPAGATGDFYVQFGEFKVKKFASLLAAKLEDSGYPARSYKEPSQNIWRIRVGPWSTPAKAQEFVPKFAQEFGGASVVLAEPKP